MKATLSLVCGTILLSAGAVRSAPSDAPAVPAFSNTSLAERTVQIIWEPNAPPPDVTHVLARLYGEEAGEIGSRLLNLEPEQARGRVKYNGTVDVRDHSCSFGFMVALDPARTGARPAAKELADALVERLSSLLAEDRRKESEVRRQRLTDEVRELDSSLEAIRRRVKEQCSNLMNEVNRVDVSAAALDATSSKLEDERQRLELDLAGMEARLAAVQEQTKDATVRAEKQAGDDPVIPELEKAVAARERVVDLTRRRYESGAAPQAEVTAAEAELVDAKVKLLDRRGAAASRGGDALAPLTHEMQSLTIDIRDRKARLAHVEERLKPLRKAVEVFRNLEALEDEEKRLRRSWEDANERLREAQRRADVAPVDRVIVTNAADRATMAPTGQ